MWRLVARKDVRDSIRERHLHIGAGLFTIVGLIAGFVYADSYDPTYVDQPGVQFLGVLVGVSLFLVPITALMLAQGRIVDKRSRGELVVLLGMPFSRRDVVVGSLAGRAAVTAAVVACLFAFATGVAALMLAPIPLARLVAALVVFAAFGALFVSIGTGISAAVAGTTRAAVGAVGVYLFFVFRLHNIVWELLVKGVYGADNVPRALMPVVAQLGPFAALRNVVVGIYPPIAGAFGYFGGPPPTDITLFATPSVGVLVLALWATVPLYLGLQRFEGADL
ncbi:ABC transporter permease subunit [Halorubellus sp. JP-L1]|uniref:ABC transporter permease subunit n=1 Tax=Halorubellus sp. JP-L1 TaxID=2715753 RepID=UPI00140D42A4|nr:ABC transporter permease subunit [Halorubellus sp. JP-L1]NHN43530.1 ABC transporter permease subunit [Halorubellus sp. JP-L1]